MIHASIDLARSLRLRRAQPFADEIGALAQRAGVDPELVVGWLFHENPTIAPLPLTAAHRAALEQHAPSAAPTHARNRAHRLASL